ncbi:MAG: hypothetical protein JNL32_04130 [Candidatus Kapabacteria bacterium]|nr:hypothetical protein [Candidatus Kapabacteria bacterium]
MKTISFLRHYTHTLLPLILGSIMLVCGGCYSFTGGSVPPHLKTISITTAVDNSNFGSPQYRELFTRQLVDKFRSDNTLSLVERDGDARIIPVITTIREEAVIVRAGDIERERKLTVSVEAEYFDAVKKKQIFKRTFSNVENYAVANAASERDRVIRLLLQRNTDDILLAVISGW